MEVALASASAHALRPTTHRASAKQWLTATPRLQQLQCGMQERKQRHEARGDEEIDIAAPIPESNPASGGSSGSDSGSDSESEREERRHKKRRREKEQDKARKRNLSLCAGLRAVM